MNNNLRNHKSYVASIGHRLSGIALALFLPIHFLLLGNAFNGAGALDQFLVYTELPLIKIAEWGLVMFLALHLLFGLRVLLLEFAAWPSHTDNFTGWVVPSTIVVLLVGIIFLVQVF